LATGGLLHVLSPNSASTFLLQRGMLPVVFTNCQRLSHTVTASEDEALAERDQLSLRQGAAEEQGAAESWLSRGAAWLAAV
jgi:hypothetical protein